MDMQGDHRYSLNNGEMKPLIQSIRDQIEDLDFQGRWETKNRVALLWVHALVGILVGIVMYVNGTASIFNQYLPDDTAQFITGSPALIGGLMLAYGLLNRPRRIEFEIAGLVTLAVWDFSMSAAFVLTEYANAVQVKAYPAVIYAGYFALLCVHLWTLRHRPKTLR